MVPGFLQPERVPVVDVEIVRAPAPPKPEAAERVVLNFERLATNKDVDVAKLERLIAMQKDILAHEARAAFNRAFARMQSEIPSIVERSQGDGGKWSYAPLEDIQTIVRPILERHGFGLSFRTEWPDRQIKVIGILTHRDGHERTSEFLAEADTSGSKNAIQARGSAVAYGRRYTTKDLLNITTRGADTDGTTSATPKAPVQHPAGYLAWLDTLRTAAQLGMAALERAYSEVPKPFRQHLAVVHPTRLAEFKAIAARRVA